MQYIITKYHWPTNTRPASVTAKQSGGPLKVRENIGPCDTVDIAEARAVERVLKTLKWGEMFRAGTHQGGSVWCFPPFPSRALLASAVWSGFGE